MAGLIRACHHIRVGKMALLQRVMVAQNSLADLMCNMLPLVSGDLCAALYFCYVEIEMLNVMDFVNYPK
jgi:hypothetical protein